MKAPLLTLNDGNMRPAVGIGTYQIRGGEGLSQLQAAIADDYRLIDSSTNYDNEGIVGKAIRRSGVPRSEFYITSKLPGKYHGYDDALTSIQESLARMGLDYFDAFLIHWPLPKRGKYIEAWQALVTAQKLGLIRSIGVSNFEPEHLDAIIEATGVTPAINQIEIHPYWVQEQMVAENRKRGIITEAWSPLGRGSALKESIITDLANKYQNLRVKSSYAGTSIADSTTTKIPKPEPSARKLSYFDFELTEEEINAINRLNKEDGRIEGQDPNEYEEFE